MSTTSVSLAGKTVGHVGHGLMQLTWNPQPVAEDQAIASMKAAADAGATAWSTATFYGNPPDNGLDNLKLLNRFFTKYPEYKEKITLVVKGGAVNQSPHKLSGKLDFLREDLAIAQKALGDKKIDVYSMTRLTDDVSFEEAFENLKTVRDEGLFTAVGVSELGVESLTKAAKIVDIAVIEIEISLWSFEQPTKDVIEWSKTHKVPIFAYSPLGRGFITRKWNKPEDIPEGSFQRLVPRFQGEAFYDNLKLVDELDKLAKQKGVTTSQLALAWVAGLSPYVIPIPGSSNVDRVKQNAASADIKLSESDLSEINKILANFEVKGTRYPDALMKQLMN